MKAVIFDCFGVLHVDVSHAFYEKHVPDYETFRPQLMEINAQSDYGLISQAERYEQVAEITGMNVDEVYLGMKSEQSRNDGLVQYAKQLRERGYLVGLLSNIGPGAMDKYFSRHEREQLFDAMVLSGEVMVTKPSPVIFEIMAERLGVDTGDCIMIDDIEDNCSGADAAGMRAVHYQTNQQAKREVEQLLQDSQNTT